eukprot:CAMPEP_0181028142 /NCGR_PEP_ID=MMETSP1070-20121207/4518_1 /TAXON_ID=265543 /ORGANISM="Minutocellus polymorphus, Strain NH13" /LENGTH=594 /DNA_ID=CAMNT_0023105387 /DNA_START=109 /DNA_END=1893 /DNA_ORIENTATION=-
MADWHSTPGSGTSTAAAASSSPPPPLPFTSRRSSVVCTNGCVASSQPLASSIGLQVLREMGGNAADAAIAVNAALTVLEPCSCGLGGDMFALYYDESERKVHAVNGSGRAPAGLSLDVLKREFSDGKGGISAEEFKTSVHSITVPGAAQGWDDFLQDHGSGRLTLAQLVEPAAKLAEGGFPISPLTSYYWSNGMPLIMRWFKANAEDGEAVVPLSMDGKGRGPKPGELFRNPELASVLRSLGKHGAKDGFYGGAPGKAIVEAIQKYGGTMTMDDLLEHTSTFPEAICAEYRDTKLWQVPPNGQGIAGLIALIGLQALEANDSIPKISGEDDLAPNSVPTAHAMIEMMRLGFADSRAFVCDPQLPGKGSKSNEWLLNKERLSKRAVDMFDPQKASICGEATPASGTVSFQVVDGDGNAVSFVNSNFCGFGTGLVPTGCGFTLQNRGFGFDLDPSHPNALEKKKRPYHTIIPGMLTHSDTGELYASISNMGGHMQPQGHALLTVALVAGNVDPQRAVDLPRFCIADGTKNGVVMLEEGFDDEVVKELSAMEHNYQSGVTSYARSVFGRAQIIKRDRSTGVLWAGSDGRADGCALGY